MDPISYLLSTRIAILHDGLKAFMGILLLATAFAMMAPLSASASAVNWTSSEIAGSLNLGTTDNVNSVSCVSTTFCVAGGRYNDATGNTQAFVSTYNGHTWSDREVAGSLNAVTYAAVNSVSCASSTLCVAGGGYTDGNTLPRSFVSVYNGSTWSDTEIGTSLRGGLGGINAVSCASNTFCVVGGSYMGGSGSTQAFVSIFNGSTWSDTEVAGSLNIGPYASIQSLSCASSSSCVAVGSYTDGNGNPQAFVSVYSNGTWSDSEVAGALNVGNDADLNSVSCSSATFCVAGGSYGDANNNLQAFVSVYNGSTWSDHELAGLLNVTTSASAIAAVNSVSCVSSTSCVVGGYYRDADKLYHGFVSVYNGSAWTDHVMASSFNASRTTVSSVSCISRTSCVAGGYYRGGNGTDNSNFQGYISVYNGSTWTDQEVAGSLNSGNNAMVESASCAVSGFCVAGGYYGAGNGQFQAFVSSTTLAGARPNVSGAVYFSSGSSTLSAAAKSLLNSFASRIASQSQSAVTLVGYTDPSGSEASNFVLAGQRTGAVKKYLKDRLHAMGHDGVTFVTRAKGITRSGSSYAKDRKVTLS